MYSFLLLIVIIMIHLILMVAFIKTKGKEYVEDIKQ